jgi:hypothetical protein
MTPALLARVGEFLSAHPKVPPKKKTTTKTTKKTTTKTTKEPPRKKPERDRGVKLPN